MSFIKKTLSITALASMVFSASVFGLEDSDKEAITNLISTSSADSAQLAAGLSGYYAEAGSDLAAILELNRIILSNALASDNYEMMAAAAEAMVTSAFDSFQDSPEALSSIASDLTQSVIAFAGNNGMTPDAAESAVCAVSRGATSGLISAAEASGSENVVDMVSTFHLGLVQGAIASADTMANSEDLVLASEQCSLDMSAFAGYPLMMETPAGGPEDDAPGSAEAEPGNYFVDITVENEVNISASAPDSPF